MLLFLTTIATSRTRLWARPPDCPEPLWEQVVEAERVAREKKGTVMDEATIEAQRIRIWEEFQRRKEPQGPFAGLRSAWDKMYKEADAMGYAQALALSRSLEDRGVLPRVVTKDAKPRDKKKKKSSRSSSSSKKGFG